MSEIYKITLADGSVLDNLGLNGNNFVSKTEITEAQFAGKLGSVKIEGPDGTQEMKNVELLQIQEWADGYYFILREKSEKELADEQLRSDVDYALMLLDE